MKTPICAFLIKDLALNLHLGWPEKERLEKQTVSVDIEIQLSEPPKACTTDQLDDTFCYADLINDMRDQVTNRSYRLLEHLCHDIYHHIKPRLPSYATIQVRVTKHPMIDDLNGGICFSYGDR
jgi:dihydroneopterin aldolase